MLFLRTRHLSTKLTKVTMTHRVPRFRYCLPSVQYYTTLSSSGSDVGGSVKGLSVAECRHRGRQVLEALLYLRQRRIRMIHLHAGNVIIDNSDACCIVDVVENMVLNLPCERGALVPASLEEERSSYYETECIYSFGRLLYNMVVGSALPIPSGDSPPAATGATLPRGCLDTSIPTELRSMLASMLLPRELVSTQRGVPDLQYVRLETFEDVVSSFRFFSDEVVVVDVRYINSRQLAGNEKKVVSKAYENSVALEEPEDVMLPLDQANVSGGALSPGSGAGSLNRGQDYGEDASPSSSPASMADSFAVDDSPGLSSGTNSLAEEEQVCTIYRHTIRISRN